MTPCRHENSLKMRRFATPRPHRQTPPNFLTCDSLFEQPAPYALHSRIVGALRLLAQGEPSRIASSVSAVSTCSSQRSSSTSLALASRRIAASGSSPNFKVNSLRNASSLPSAKALEKLSAKPLAKPSAFHFSARVVRGSFLDLGLGCLSASWRLSRGAPHLAVQDCIERIGGQHQLHPPIELGLACTGQTTRGGFR
jgi:hypothetical protein